MSIPSSDSDLISQGPNIKALRRIFKAFLHQARIREISVYIDFLDFCFIRQYGCFYCGADLPQFGSGLDRIDSSLGYSIGNIKPCCGSCNQVKGSHVSDLEMFLVISLLGITRGVQKKKLWETPASVTFRAEIAQIKTTLLNGWKELERKQNNLKAQMSALSETPNGERQRFNKLLSNKGVEL